MSVGLVSTTALAIDRTPSIIGGTFAEEGAWPSAVSIRLNGDFHTCAGTLIDPEWVLTAAHCVSGQSISSLSIVLGRQNFNTSEGEQIGVKKTIMHPSYDSLTLDNDIALIQLEYASWSETTLLATPSSMGNYTESPTLMTVIG